MNECSRCRALISGVAAAFIELVCPHDITTFRLCADCLEWFRSQMRTTINDLRVANG